MSLMDLSAVPILDHHCHAFVRPTAPYTKAEFLRLFSEGGDDGIVARHTANSVFVRWAVKELARFFGCAPTLEGVLQARAGVPEGELGIRLLRDANIPALLIDYGLPGPGRLSVDEMRTALPGWRVEPVLRLEVLAQDLMGQHTTFEDWAEAFTARVEGARAAGHVGLKSIIAYRTGLAIHAPAEGEARHAWARARVRAEREGRVRLADKPLNDFLVLRALEIASRHELPIQFHTGLGDNDLDMWYANPLHMRPLFESPAFKRVPFVLLHASYPYVRELGYLASLYSHVWMDLGLAVPFATVDIPAVWRQALSLTPFSKLLFSTDAYSAPEIFWIAARWGRWGLGLVLDELKGLGAFSDADAQEAAEHILWRNAAALYQVTL